MNKYVKQNLLALNVALKFAGFATADYRLTSTHLLYTEGSGSYIVGPFQSTATPRKTDHSQALQQLPYFLKQKQDLFLINPERRTHKLQEARLTGFPGGKNYILIIHKIKLSAVMFLFNFQILSEKSLNFQGCFCWRLGYFCTFKTLFLLTCYFAYLMWLVIVLSCCKPPRVGQAARRVVRKSNKWIYKGIYKK